MMTDFNLFSTWMKNKILWDIYSTRVVTVYIHGLLLNSIVFKLLFYPQELHTIALNNNILSLGSKYGYKVLFLTNPSHKTITNKKKAPDVLFSILYIFCLINIGMSNNDKRRIIGIPQTIIKSSIYIVNYSFNSS